MSKRIIGYGDFFCANCGKRIERKVDACPHCGTTYSDEEKYAELPAPGVGGVGWSTQTEHPCFKRYAGHYTKFSLIFLVALSVLVPTGLVASGDISVNAEGLTVIGVMLGAFWLFGLGFLIFKRGKDSPDWEGIVEDKRIKKNPRARYHEFTVLFRAQDGTGHTITRNGNSEQLDYFEIGDRVRYHGSRYLRYLEKYDKSCDTIIFCAACGQIRDIRDNYCGACGCILLKAKISQ